MKSNALDNYYVQMHILNNKIVIDSIKDLVPLDIHINSELLTITR